MEKRLSIAGKLEELRRYDIHCNLKESIGYNAAKFMANAVKSRKKQEIAKHEENGCNCE